MKTSPRSLRRLMWPIGIAAILATGAIVADNASGATPEGITTSEVTVSPSMVRGSSPTSLGDSPLAQTPAGRAAAATSGVTTSYAVITTYDPTTGQVLATKRYGPRTEGKVLTPPTPTTRDNGTGGTSTASGCMKVEIWQKRTTFLGAFAAKWGVWTDWCWTRANQTVSINAKGRDLDVAPGYSFDGVADQDAYFYDFSVDDGHPRSAYHHHKKGGFSSPSGGVLPGGHWYPKNTLDSYYNGTNQWFTSD